MCDQQRLRPDCAHAQSDQSRCLSLEYSLSVQLPTEHHFECLSLTGGCTGCSESTRVKMPHSWKSHVAAQMYFINKPVFSIKYKLACVQSDQSLRFPSEEMLDPWLPIVCPSRLRSACADAQADLSL